MNPGELNHRITFIEDINKGKNIKNENGFPVENWQPWKTIWCKKTGTIVRKYNEEDAKRSETEFAFKIRFMKGIRTDMRIVDSDGTYIIKGLPIDKKGSRKELIVTAYEVTLQ